MDSTLQTGMYDPAAFHGPTECKPVCRRLNITQRRGSGNGILSLLPALFKAVGEETLEWLRNSVDEKVAETSAAAAAWREHGRSS